MNAISEAIPNPLAALPVSTGTGLPASGPGNAGGFASCLAAAQQGSSAPPRPQSIAQFATGWSTGLGNVPAYNSSGTIAVSGQTKKLAINLSSASGGSSSNAPVGLAAMIPHYVAQTVPIPLPPSPLGPVTSFGVGNAVVAAVPSLVTAPANAEMSTQLGTRADLGVATKLGISMRGGGSTGGSSAIGIAPFSSISVEPVIGVPSTQSLFSLARPSQPFTPPQPVSQPIQVPPPEPSSSGLVSSEPAPPEPQLTDSPAFDLPSSAPTSQPLVSQISEKAISFSTTTPISPDPLRLRATSPSLSTEAPPLPLPAPTSSADRSSSSNSDSSLTLLASVAIAPPISPWSEDSTQVAARPTVTPAAAPESPLSFMAGVVSGGANPSSILQGAAPSLALSNQTPLPSPAGPVPVATPARSAYPVVPAVPSSATKGSTQISPETIPLQTPFSVFFSASGGSAESATATLPKMILPATNAMLHSPSSVLPTASGNAPSGTSSGGAASSLGIPAIKPAQPGSQGDSLTSRRDGSASLLNPTSSTPSSFTVNSANTGAPNQQIISPSAPIPAGALASPLAAAPVPLANVSAAPADPLPRQSASTSTPGNFPPTTPQPQPTALPGPVQVAQIVSRAGQSEMRIGLNTSAFGSVEVRTTVHSTDVGLIIGSEKGDLRGLLTNEMPALTNSLQQQSLRLNSVNFTQSATFANDMSGGGNSQQRSFVPQPSPANYGNHSPEQAGNESVETKESSAPVWAGVSLSILA